MSEVATELHARAQERAVGASLSDPSKSLFGKPTPNLNLDGPGAGIQVQVACQSQTPTDCTGSFNFKWKLPVSGSESESDPGSAAGPGPGGPTPSRTATHHWTRRLRAIPDMVRAHLPVFASPSPNHCHGDPRGCSFSALNSGRLQV